MTDAAVPQPPQRRLGLATQVFIGLGLGILTGVFFGDDVAFLRIGGDIFISLLQITVIPYVVVALITSLAWRCRGRRPWPTQYSSSKAPPARVPPAVPTSVSRRIPGASS